MSEDYKDEYILDIIENQHYTTHTILSSLLTVQDDIGYLPKNSINVVAEFMDVSINDVWGVARLNGKMIKCKLHIQIILLRSMIKIKFQSLKQFIP